MIVRCKYLTTAVVVAFGAMMLFAMTEPLSAQTAGKTETTLAQKFAHSHQLGARIGGWANRGVLPPDSFSFNGNGYYLTDIGGGDFYLEGFFGYRFNRALMLEFSLGIVSRGDVYLVEPDDGGSSIGTVQLYPILAKLKFYPFAPTNWKLCPYVLAGGGFYYGRHDMQITTGLEAYYRSEFGEDSETDFNYVLGGGVDWPLASVIALNLNAQYMPIGFSSNLVGSNDYSALTITVGVTYLMSSLESKRTPHRSLSRR
jgi:opacity protein-like surface antigen